MGNWKIFLLCFSLGVLSAVGMTCKTTHIKQEEIKGNVEADKAVIKKNGDVLLEHPRFNFEESSLDKTSPAVTGLGFYLGAGVDPLHPEKINGALGFNLGPVFPLVTSDLSSIQVHCLIHF